MDAWAGPFFAAALLLTAGGVLELHRPEPTVAALRALGVRAGRVSVRVGAAVLAATGVAGVAFGGPELAGAVGAWFAAFSVFVLVARRRGAPLTSCGCFGRADTPPTVTHAVVNLGAALVAAGAAATGIDGVGAVASRQPWLGVPFVVATVVCAWLAYLTLTVLPRALALGGARVPA